MQKNFSQSGFTLVELLVSLGIFTIVVIAAVSSLYTVNQAAVRVNSMRTVLDNLNFATESMSRTIRTGANVVCGGAGTHIGGVNCPFGTTAGSTVIALDTTIGTPKSYQYQLNTTNGSIERCPITGNSATGTVQLGNCVAITAPEITIQKMNFFVDGADPADNKQPSVIIRMQGVANAGPNNTAPFVVQTYVSQRAGE